MSQRDRSATFDLTCDYWNTMGPYDLWLSFKNSTNLPVSMRWTQNRYVEDFISSFAASVVVVRTFWGAARGGKDVPKDDYVSWVSSCALNAQYSPRNVYMVSRFFVLVVLSYKSILPISPGLLHWHWGSNTTQCQRVNRERCGWKNIINPFNTRCAAVFRLPFWMMSAFLKSCLS